MPPDIKSSHHKTTERGYDFEDLVSYFFQALGYVVVTDAAFGSVRVDLLASLNGRRFPVEISAVGHNSVMAKVRRDAERLNSIRTALPFETNPVIVTAAKLTDEAKEWAHREYAVDVWDIGDLLEKADGYPHVRSEIDKFINRHGIDLGLEPPSSDIDALIARLLSHIVDKSTLTPTEYEDICMQTFIALFDPYLYGFEKQSETSDGGNRYDFICRIQGGSEFWTSVRQDFRTKAILFECKNYEEPIGPDQIYSTERYLFAGALRTVCILTSRLGANDAAKRAAQGAMRESGKLIILLSNADLIEMLKLCSQAGAAEGLGLRS